MPVITLIIAEQTMALYGHIPFMVAHGIAGGKGQSAVSKSMLAFAAADYAGGGLVSE